MSTTGNLNRRRAASTPLPSQKTKTHHVTSLKNENPLDADEEKLNKYFHKKITSYANNLNEQKNNEKITSTSVLDSQIDIIKFIKSNQNKPDNLIKIYDLIMLIDESTKSNYKFNIDVKIFQNNLWRIIGSLFNEGLQNDIELQKFSAAFIALGHHDNEKWDKACENIFGLKLNTKSINKLKKYIKKIITTKHTQLIKKLKHGKEIRNNFFTLIVENITKYIPHAFRERKIYNNYKKFNPQTLRHAAEHKILHLHSYKNMLSKLRKHDTHLPVEKCIENEIAQQEKIVKNKRACLAAGEKDFNLPQKIKKMVLKCFIDAGYKKEDFHKEFQISLAEITSSILTQGMGKRGKRVLNSTFYVPIVSLNSHKKSNSWIKIMRKSSTEFIKVNSSLGIQKKLNGEAIGNPFMIKITQGKKLLSTQFQCAAIYSELSAKQYIVKMLLNNMKQTISENRIYLIDSRQLKNGNYRPIGKALGCNEIEVLEKHRQEINKQIELLNNWITNKDKTSLNEWLNKSDVNLEETDRNSLLDNKRIIKFFSLNFSPYSKQTGALNGLGGQTCKKTLNFLEQLSQIFQNKDKKSEENMDPDGRILFKQRLIDLQKVIEEPKTYLAGHASLVPAKIIGDLLNLFHAIPSIGCRYNKDRGSNATLHHALLDAVYAYRRAKNGEQTNISCYQFTLKDEWESHILRTLYNQNIWYLPTLYNVIYAGNKSPKAHIKPFINQAFTKKEQAKHQEQHKYTKKVKVA